jgi:hypothetical protein
MHVLSVVFTVLRFDVEMGLVNGSIGTVVDFPMHEATHEISAVLVKFPNIRHFRQPHNNTMPGILI